MTRLYFVRANAYDMIIGDDGDIRRVFSGEALLDLMDKHVADHHSPTDEELKALLASIKDNSSWEAFEETVEELATGCDVLATIDTTL